MLDPDPKHRFSDRYLPVALSPGCPVVCYNRTLFLCGERFTYIILNLLDLTLIASRLEVLGINCVLLRPRLSKTGPNPSRGTWPEKEGKMLSHSSKMSNGGWQTSRWVPAPFDQVSFEPIDFIWNLYSRYTTLGTYRYLLIIVLIS